MTETVYTAPETPKKKRKIFLPVLIVVLVLAVAGFLISRAGFDKAIVKQKLDEYIQVVREKSREQGRDVNITYGDLDVKGSFANKHVIVHEVALTIKPLNPKNADAAAAKTDSLVVTTPEIDIYPKAVDLSSLLISLPQPINFAGEDAPEKSLMKLTASSPLEATVTQETIDKVVHTKVSHTAPASLDFTYLREQQAVGTEDKAPTLTPVYDTLHVAIASGSITTDMTANGSGVGQADTVYKQITMAPQSAPQGIITIAAMESHWSNVLNDKKRNQVHAVSNIGPITGTPDVLPYAPISFALDLSYEGFMSRTPEAIAAAGSQDPTITLKTFSLTLKDASVTANADFTASPTDILPVGTAVLNVNNVPFVLAELRKYGFLTPDNEGWVDVMIEQATGAPIATLNNVSIPVERSHGGAFKIGKSTFEELLATVVKHAMQQRAGIPAASGAPAATVPGTVTAPVPTSHAPTLPPADKPKAAPIAVPDNGVRG